MMMHENICEQCKKAIAGPSNRLVQDTCGHKKCRVCLVEDVESCKQCVVRDIVKNGENNEIINSLLNLSNESTIKDCEVNNEDNNCAAVIQCNGNTYGSALNEGTENDESVSPEPTQSIPKETKQKCKSNQFNRIFCNRSFTLPKHVTENLDPLSYHCNICNSSFLTKSHAKYHLYCDGETKPHLCNICQKGFVLKSQLEAHMNRHNGIKAFSCNLCPKMFSEKSKLKRHLEGHNPERIYVCSECGNTFQTKECLKTHSIIHKGKIFACKLCSAKFSNRSNLKRHYVSHSKDKFHMCDQCGKRFKQKWALSIHRRSHLRDRPYECDHCTKSFVNNKDLQRHNLIHADIKGFTCSICGTSFRRKDNLGRHMKNTHPGKEGTVIKNVVKLPDIVPKKQIVDNPNAIHVITAPPAFTKGKAVALHPAKSTDSRPGTVIFGPIKLAFKTPAFKSHYNINRDLNDLPPAQIQKTYDHSESLEICQKIFNPPPLANLEQPLDDCLNKEVCQKILSPYRLTEAEPKKTSNEKTIDPLNREVCQKILSSYSSSEVINKEVCQKILSPYRLNEAEPRLNDEKNVDPLNKAVCQKILSPYASSEVLNKEVCHKILAPYSGTVTPLHYETSFQNRKHAMIKNIKFKVPLEYTQNNFKQSECLKPVDNFEGDTNAGTSVIVNNSANHPNSVHWRRRTSQNLTLKE